MTVYAHPSLLLSAAELAQMAEDVTVTGTRQDAWTYFRDTYVVTDETSHAFAGPVDWASWAAWQTAYFTTTVSDPRRAYAWALAYHCEPREGGAFDAEAFDPECFDCYGHATEYAERVRDMLLSWAAVWVPNQVSDCVTLSSFDDITQLGSDQDTILFRFAFAYDLTRSDAAYSAEDRATLDAWFSTCADRQWTFTPYGLDWNYANDHADYDYEWRPDTGLAYLHYRRSDRYGPACDSFLRTAIGALACAHAGGNSTVVGHYTKTDAAYYADVGPENESHYTPYTSYVDHALADALTPENEGDYRDVVGTYAPVMLICKGPTGTDSPDTTDYCLYNLHSASLLALMAKRLYDELGTEGAAEDYVSKYDDELTASWEYMARLFEPDAVASPVFDDDNTRTDDIDYMTDKPRFALGYALTESLTVADVCFTEEEHILPYADWEQQYLGPSMLLWPLFGVQAELTWFGNSYPDTGSMADWRNYKGGSRFTLLREGDVTKLTAYLSNTATGHAACHATGMIYADSAGAPGALLATTNEVAIADNAALAWVDFTLASPYHLTPGVYWLTLIFDGSSQGLDWKFRSWEGTAAYNADTYAGGPADPFGTPTAKTWTYAIYASVTATYHSTVITVTAPAASTTWTLGSNGTISFTIGSAVSVGQFELWAIKDFGDAGEAWTWVGDLPAVPAQTAYSLDFTTSGLTLGSYTAYVAYRVDPDIWGNWDAVERSDADAATLVAAGGGWTYDVATVVPQLPAVVTCIQYVLSGVAPVENTSDIVAVTAGQPYQVGPYVRVSGTYHATLALEAVVYDGAAEQRTVAIGSFSGDADWERYIVTVTPSGGEDGIALRETWTPTGSGTMTTQMTAMSIVAEDTPSAYFSGTRVDSGIYGDSERAAPGLPNEVTADNGIWARYGPTRLYEGWLLTPQDTYESDARWYVPAGSYLDRGRRNQTFGRIYKDSDISQWHAMEDRPSWCSGQNSGDKYRILVRAGNPVPAEDLNVVYPITFYWLADGLRSDLHIDTLTFTLTKVGTVDAGLTLGVMSWAVPPIPGAANTAEVAYTVATADGAKTVTLTGADKIAVGFYVKSTSAGGWTATVDNGFDIENLVITTSAGTVDVGEALADLAKVIGIAADHALSTYTDTSVSTLVARPMTTVSAAQESIVSLSAYQLVWGYTPGGWFDSEQAADPDITAKSDRARWWSLSQADCTFTSNVIDDGEGFYDYVTVLYAAISVAGVTDGTLRKVTRAPGGVDATPADTARVYLLNFSGRYMTTAEANAVADQWLLWQGPTTGASGTITISGDVRDVDGHVRCCLMIQPGDWVEERERRGHRPWLVTGVHYEVSGRVQVAVGGVERIFPIIAPGLGGIYTDEALGSWSAAGDAAETAGLSAGDAQAKAIADYYAANPWAQWSPLPVSLGGTGGTPWQSDPGNVNAGVSPIYMGAGGVMYLTPDDATASWLEDPSSGNPRW